jgi:hypothetical protein
MFLLGRTTRRALASRTITAATVTSHLVRCPRSVTSTPYVVPGASLPERRTYLNARYSTFARPSGNGLISFSAARAPRNSQRQGYRPKPIGLSLPCLIALVLTVLSQSCPLPPMHMVIPTATMMSRTPRARHSRVSLWKKPSRSTSLFGRKPSK